jgi:hypothetical protein
MCQSIPGRLSQARRGIVLFQHHIAIDAGNTSQKSWSVPYYRQEQANRP